jgi:hypothetical protein
MIAAKMGMGSATVPVAAFGVSPNASAFSYLCASVANLKINHQLSTIP